MEAEQPIDERRCPDCLTGRQRKKYLTYFTWFQEQLITVPDFPSWVCDVCGMREYDARAITWLNTLLNSQRPKKKDRKPGEARSTSRMA
jgi:YgiT-type zinc finger domain-containing protein